MTRKLVQLTREQAAALDGAWSTDQARDFVRLLFQDLGEAWTWMSPQVREAVVAERAFAIVRCTHRGTAEVKDMDRLLLAMRVLAGLAGEEW